MEDFKLEDRKISKDGKYVYKTGLIFRAGDYPDKKFTMTPEEIVEAEAKFKPVPIDVEHHSNMGILDGKLGTLEAVLASEDGEELYGTAKIPVWLDELHGNSPFKVSCTWNKADKNLHKLAIVQNPRVSDAALFAAFSANEVEQNPEKTGEVVSAFFSWMVENQTEFKDKTWSGRDSIQSVHDMVARTGAVCTKPPKDSKAKMSVEDSERAEFISKDEAAALQKIHDLAISNGAKCYFIDDAAWSNYTEEAAETSAEGKNMTFSMKDIIAYFKGLSDAEVASVEQEIVAASATPALAVDAEKEELRRQVAEYKAKEEAKTEAKAETVEASTEAVEDVEDEEKKLLREQLETYKRQAAEKEAKTFSEELIKSSKILPAQAEFVQALFSQASADDAVTAASTVKFGEGEEISSRVETLKAFFNSLQPTTITRESMGVLSFNKEGKDASEDATKQAAEFAKKRNSLRAKKD